MPVAKPKKTSSAQTGQNRTYLIIGAVALVVLAVVAFTMMGNGGQAARAPVATTFDPSQLQQARGVAMGPENAPVLVYEFADYQCPACAQFSTFAHPLIKERLVDQGVIRFVRYDFPLVNAHPHAFLASRAARCAGDQGRYWEYHDVLYGRQPTWSSVRDPSAEFVDYAQLVGIDRRQFQQCLRSDQHAEEVTRNLRLGESLGVSGTPTLMVNGERVQLRDYRDLEQRVMEAAGRSPAEAGMPTG
jgi:protein-disulfide isomerase